jgi:hypothetical protein
MPEEMERELKATAKRRGYSKKRTGAYVYGTMRKSGWKPSTQNPVQSPCLTNAGEEAKKSFYQKRGK